MFFSSKLFQNIRPFLAIDAVPFVCTPNERISYAKLSCNIFFKLFLKC